MVWWCWGESITIRHGLTKDLEALKDAGFGGVVLYEQAFKDTLGALKSPSPEWLEHVQFAGVNRLIADAGLPAIRRISGASVAISAITLFFIK